MDINVNVNVWFLVSLCLLCILAGLIYGMTTRKRLEREQAHLHDRDRRYY